MFLAFFPMLLIVFGVFSSWARTSVGTQDIVRSLSAILPPGTRQVVADFILRRADHPWHWALLGWSGTVLAGTQVMKLLMEGIQIIHGDADRHSFLGRQFRALALLLVTIAPFLVAVLLTVFGKPLRHWTIHQSRWTGLVRGVWAAAIPLGAMVLAMTVLAVIYRVARPVKQRWREVAPGAAAATLFWWTVNALFGIYVRKMQYSLVYGGLAAAIGLMVWMQLSAAIVFLGAAWNAEAAARALEGGAFEGKMPA